MRKLNEEEAWQSLYRRLDARVDRSAGPLACWPYTGHVGVNGYGQIGLAGSSGVGAHRATLERKIGRRLNRWEFACHACDFPACCNPAHLFVGSPADNLIDASTKGRLAKDTCRRGHPRTPENVYAYTVNGYTRRACRPCNRLNWNQRHSKAAN